MNDKKTLMIDMDDVIVSDGFLYLLNDFLGTDYKESDFTDFYMQHIIPKELIQDFFEYFFTKNMYDYCKINDNAYEVIKELNEKYKLIIATAYTFKENIMGSGIILKQKYDFLLQNFDFLNPDNLVFLTDKSTLYCHIRIDDNIKNLNGPGIERKFLYTAYHNRNISKQELESQNIERIDNWNHVKKLLLK